MLSKIINQILVEFGLPGRLCMHSWRSAATFPILWYCKQGNYSDRQVWPAKGFCLCGIPWNRCCSRGSPVEWVWITWPSTEGNSISFNELVFLVLQRKLNCLFMTTWHIFQVLPKRTNVPGMKQYRPRRFNPYMGYRGRRPYVPPYFYSPYGYGYVCTNGCAVFP